MYCVAQCHTSVSKFQVDLFRRMLFTALDYFVFVKVERDDVVTFLLFFRLVLLRRGRCSTNPCRCDVFRGFGQIILRPMHFGSKSHGERILE
ncbi:hypothetical protein NDN08_004810 [Rhodosorus marinus]|uniref:Uncharacterized protein n=1 Tax=Rhodosorus marinus TaxID=101924 RepID=A0AAV8UMC4_9RHOD|nr:hypothetical protein NDN08_004810 [Rhodosorus marinus]